MLKIIRITAKEMNEKYCGARGGYVTGSHYALYEESKGFCSFDGKRAYILAGKYGKAALQKIIDDGGFCCPINYVPTI